MRAKTSACGLLLLPAVFAWSAESRAAAVDGTSHWQQASVDLVVDESLRAVDERAYDAVVGAITAWQREESNLPTLVAKRGQVGPIGFRRDGENENSIRFMQEGAEVAKGALGVTIVTSEASTGRIVDADIVLNGEYAFAMLASAGEGGMPYDLQNVLTHEVGHFLGLPEEREDKQATMFATSRAGEVLKRDINATDRHAVGELYEEPPAQEEEAVGCGGATIATRKPGRTGWWPLLALAALAFRQKRANRSGTPSRRTPIRHRWWATLCVLAAALSLSGESKPRAMVAIGSSYQDGIIWTHYAVSTDCSSCEPQIISIAGGSHEGLHQRVSALRLPSDADASCSSH